MSIWMLIILGGLVTYFTRLSFIALYGKIRFPDWLHRSLKYVPCAVLTAIILPEILFSSGHLDLSIGNVRLVAGSLAVLIAFLTRNTMITISSGMIILWLLEFLR